MEMLRPSFIHYRDLRAFRRNIEPTQPCHLKVVCTPESLHRIPLYDGQFMTFDVVVVDEFTLVTCGLADAVTHDKTLFTHMHILQHVLTHSRQNIIMCADFLSSDINIQLLHSWSINLHVSIVLPPGDRSLLVYEGNQALFDRILFASITSGERVYVACSTRAECVRLWQLCINLLSDADQQFNRSVNRLRMGDANTDEDMDLVKKRRAEEEPAPLHFYYHSGCGSRQTDDFKDVNTAWSEASAIFTTTKASVGISCTLENHFDRIFCYILPHGAGVREMMQLTMRVRQPRSREVSVYVSRPGPGPVEEIAEERVDVYPAPWRCKTPYECEAEERELQERHLGQWKKLWEIYNVADHPLRPQYTQLRMWRAFEQSKDRFTLLSLFEVADRNNWEMRIMSLDDEVEKKEEVVDELTANWSSFEERMHAHLATCGETMDEVIQRRTQHRRTQFEKDVGEFLLAQRPYIGTPLERLFFYAPHVHAWVNKHSGAIFRVARMLRGPIAFPLPEGVVVEENSNFSESESYRKVPSSPWDWDVRSILDLIGLYPLVSSPPRVSDDVIREHMAEMPIATFPPAWTKANTLRKNVAQILSKALGLSVRRIPHSHDSSPRWLAVETGENKMRTTIFDWASALVVHDSAFIN